VDEAALPHVNAFRRTGEGTFDWIDLHAKGNVPNDALRRGNVEFFVEAKSFATGRWNGEARLTLTIDRPGKAGAPVFKDTVVLRAAPWIMLSNLDRANVLYVREFPERNDAMLEQLRALMPDIEAQLHVVPGDAPYPPNNIWMQDTMEIGFTQKTPVTRMSAVLKANRDKGLDAFAKDGLLGPDSGWFTCGEFRPQFGAGDGGTSWMDWFGNLEVTPALDDYPYGRVYYGVAGEGKSLNPDVVALIDAQGIQGPALPIDVRFLLIKHADELICFLPSGNPENPYKVLVPDVRLMLELATEWEKSGYGNIAMLTNFRDGLTVRSFLADAGLRSHNMRLQEQHLDPLYEQLKSAFGLRDDDLIHIPAYYERDGRSMIPNMVNSAFANGFLLVPQPNGPVFGHYDLLEDDFRERLAGLPLEVHFLDDRQYHKWCGNVHCATNAKRESARRVWWE
jgi:protein-arginine deiminase